MRINSCFLLLLMMLGVTICTSNDVAVEGFKRKRSDLQAALTKWNDVKAEESRFEAKLRPKVEKESSGAVAYAMTVWGNFWGNKGKDEMREREILSQLFKDEDENKNKNKKVEPVGGSAGKSAMDELLAETENLGEWKRAFYSRRKKELEKQIEEDGFEAVELFEQAISRQPFSRRYARTSFWLEMWVEAEKAGETKKSWMPMGSTGGPKSLVGQLREAVRKVEELSERLERRQLADERDRVLQRHRRQGLPKVSGGGAAEEKKKKEEEEEEGVVDLEGGVRSMDTLGLKVCVLLVMLERNVEHEAAFIQFWEGVSKWKLECENSGGCRIMR